jgi:hypothetical protein
MWLLQGKRVIIRDTMPLQAAGEKKTENATSEIWPSRRVRVERDEQRSKDATGFFIPKKETRIPRRRRRVGSHPRLWNGYKGDVPSEENPLRIGRKLHGPCVLQGGAESEISVWRRGSTCAGMPSSNQPQAVPSQLAQGPFCSFSQTSHPSRQRSRVDEDAPSIQSESLLEWSLTVVSACARVRAKVNRDLHEMNLNLTSLQRSTTLRKWVLDSNVITSPLCYLIRGPLACSSSLTGSRFWARCALWLLHVRS